MESTQSFHEKINIFIRQCIAILKAKLWLWVLFCFVAVSVAFLKTSMEKPIYTAVAKMSVAPAQTSLNVTALPYFSEKYFIHFYVTQYYLLHSKDLLSTLIAEMDLQKRLSENKRYRLSEEIAINILQHALQIVYYEEANVLQVHVTMKDRELATEIANRFVDVFKRSRQSFRQERLDGILEKLGEKLETARTKLEESEQYLETLKREQNLTYYEGLNIDNVQLLLFNQLYLDAKVERLQEEIKLEKFKELPLEARSNLVAIELSNIGSNDIHGDNIITLKRMLADAQIELVQLQQNYGPEYPEVKEAASRVKQITEKIEYETDGIIRGLEIKYEVIKKREQDLKDTIEEARNRLFDRESSEMLYLRAYQDMLGDKETYVYLKKQYLTQLALYDLPEQTVHLIEKARVPRKDEKVAPQRFLSMLVSGFTSFWLGLILVLIYGFVEEELFARARRTAFSVLSIIPSNVGKINDLPHDSIKYEAFRVIAMRLDMINKKKHSKTILIASNGAAEGRSLATVNISYALGDMGKRVLVVDANLRKPDLPAYFDIIEPAYGVRHLAEYKDDYKQLIIPIVYNNVDLLPAGTSGKGTDCDLNLDQMQSLITELKPYYDFILLDGPPLMGFGDSLLLAGVADQILVIVAHKMYPQMDKKAIRKYIEVAGGDLMGVVVNKVSPSDDIYKTYYQVAFK